MLSTARDVRLWVTVHGPAGSSRLTMALDTASTFVTIPLGVARYIGYNVDDPSVTTPIITSMGTTRAPLVELDSVEAVDGRAFGVLASCLDLPRTAGFRGLLGLSFLRNFDVDLHFRSGVIAFR